MPESTTKTPRRALAASEDLCAMALAGALMAPYVLGLATKAPGPAAWAWPHAAAALPPDALGPMALLALLLGAAFNAALWAAGAPAARRFLPGFAAVFAAAALALALGREETAKAYDLGYALWAVGLGLLLANTCGVPAWLAPAVRAELYIKTGLVMLGAEVLFNNLLKFGVYGAIVAWCVCPLGIVFMWLYGTRLLKMDNKPLVITLAAATSVCGVSAAVAAGAACRAKKEDLAIAIGVSLLFTVLMMILMPAAVRALGMPDVIAGAWLGGVIDSTGAVVAAGAALGPEAEAVAAVVKMIQNLLIGVIAFAIAVYWVSVVEHEAGAPGVGPGEIWRRLPKFVLGFVLASILSSFVLVPWLGGDAVEAILKQTRGVRDWLFCMAFVCVGLESNLKEMAGRLRGGKPLHLYLAGQTFNLALTLAMAYLALSGILLPPPPALAP